MKQAQKLLLVALRSAFHLVGYTHCSDCFPLVLCILQGRLLLRKDKNSTPGCFISVRQVENKNK